MHEQQQEQQDLETLEEQTRIQLLARGNYTCRTKPTNAKENEPQYQNKIQMKNDITEKAEKISAILKTIPQYNLYFQPIIESESIELGKITEDNIEECEKTSVDTTQNHESMTNNQIIQQQIQQQTQMNLSRFVSLKTRYYAQTWQQQMLTIKEAQPTKLLTIFMYTIQHMLQILKHLQSKNIVHFNIMKQSMLASNIRILPVLTNYNLSFQIEDLKKEAEMEILFPNYDEYEPWPIEVYLASRIANIKENAKTPEEWTTRFIEKEELEKWIDAFSQSPVFKKIASDERRELMAINLKEYFKPIINKPMKSLYENILLTAHTWDTYAMCILWLNTLILLEFHEKIEEYNFIREFINTIKTVVYANPNERQSIENIEQTIQTIFGNIPEKIYKKFNAELMQPTEER